MCENGVRMQGFHGEKARYFCGALLCTAFLGGLLKENGEVSAVIRTDGTLQNITASASAALNVRACMDCRKEGENGGEESMHDRNCESIRYDRHKNNFGD